MSIIKERCVKTQGDDRENLLEAGWSTAMSRRSLLIPINLAHGEEDYDCCGALFTIRGCRLFCQGYVARTKGMVNHMTVRGGILAMFVSAFSCLALSPMASAEPYWHIRPRVLVPYEPSMLTSMEEVGKVFTANINSYANWCSVDQKLRRCFENLAKGKVTGINLSASHLDLLSVEQPSLISASFDTANIGAIEIYQFPKLNEAFPWALKISSKSQASDKRVFWLRVSDEEVAKKLADAVATLGAVGSGVLDLAPLVPSFGISARSLTPEELKDAGISGGLYIGTVTVGSPAAQLGFLNGDLLLEINGARIADLEAAKKALSAAPVQSAKAWRNGKVITLSTLAKM